jgi:hypothetical protein
MAITKGILQQAAAGHCELFLNVGEVQLIA